jgi:FkbM family methyltransferase
MGTARLRLPDGERDIQFDGRNTQFQALYMPEFLPCYEPETTALIESIVGTSGTFFDIGANWGWYTVVVASRPDFSGTVHALEPNPPSFADLVSIISQAGLGAHVQCHNLAVGNDDGNATMSIPDGLHSGLAKLDKGGGVRIKVVRLDSLDLPPPDVMKLDVEDHEYDALLGSQRVIAAARPVLIFENWSYPLQPNITSAPLRLLEEWGYQLYFQAWLAENGELHQDISWSGGVARFGLVPFSSLYRGLLPSHANIVAIPEERVSKFRALLERGGSSE